MRLQRNPMKVLYCADCSWGEVIPPSTYGDCLMRMPETDPTTCPHCKGRLESMSLPIYKEDLLNSTLISKGIESLLPHILSWSK